MPSFREPNTLDRVINRIFGLLVSGGLGLSHNYLLMVRGRRSGRLYRTPVNLLITDGRMFLVAPRGETQWVRNARSSGELWLKKGKREKHFQIRELADADKPEILKLYLDRFRTTVQRYFSVQAGTEVQSFVEVASEYPVFELESAGNKN